MASVKLGMPDPLKKLGARIDAVDNRLLELLNERAGLALEVGRVKQNGVKYRPEREAQVLRRLAAAGAGPLRGPAVRRQFTEIMSSCRALEEALRVAYLGPRGTFSDEAVVKHFGTAAVIEPCASIDEVFRRVEAGQVGYGVVPVENSTEGRIGRTLDLWLATPLKVCGEVLLPVHQCLMSRSGSAGRVKRILSHSQSLAQCQWARPRVQRGGGPPVREESA